MAALVAAVSAAHLPEAETITVTLKQTGATDVMSAAMTATITEYGGVSI